MPGVLPEVDRFLRRAPTPQRFRKSNPVGRRVFLYAIDRRGVAVIDVRSGTVVSRSNSRPPLRGDFILQRAGHEVGR